jgi:Uma2 family endonuclease
MTIDLDLKLSTAQATAQGEPRITLEQISWQQYEGFLSLIGPRPNLHLSYLQGTLEIMPLSLRHEALKAIIARLLYVYADVMGIDLFSCGSTTFKRAITAVGLEPDESYCLDRRKEYPDLAIEVVITSDGIDKLEIYRGLDVSEVWFWQDQNFSLYHLRADKSGYDRSSQSHLFPQLDFLLMTKYVLPEEEPQAVRAWQKLLSSSL